MKNLKMLFMIAGCVFLLGGCNGNNSTVDAGEENNSVSSDDGINQEDYDILYEKYININELPVFNLDIEREYICDDRKLILEDSIQNELEYVIYQYYYNNISADFESNKNLIGESESLRISNENEKEAFDEGKYTKEYNIHELSVVDKDEIKEAQEMTKDNLLADIKECGLESYAVVKAELGWKYSEAKLQAGPQLPEGDYIRYYLVGSTKDDSEVKICQVYWDSL